MRPWASRRGLAWLSPSAASLLGAGRPARHGLAGRRARPGPRAAARTSAAAPPVLPILPAFARLRDAPRAALCVAADALRDRRPASPTGPAGRCGRVTDAAWPTAAAAASPVERAPCATADRPGPRPAGAAGLARRLAVDRSAAERLPATTRHSDAAAAAARLGPATPAIARRLARRWRLPAWLAASSATSTCPRTSPRRSGPTRTCSASCSWPSLLAQRTVGAGPGRRARTGGRGSLALDGRCSTGRESQPPREPTRRASVDPPALPLLRRLLALAPRTGACASRRRVERLERDVDRLHRALAERSGRRGGAPAAPQAGGAGRVRRRRRPRDQQPPGRHLRPGPVPARPARPNPAGRQALQTIIGQTQRIHDLLTRPDAVRPPAAAAETAVDRPADWFGDVAGTPLGDLARPRPVQLD